MQIADTPPEQTAFQMLKIYKSTASYEAELMAEKLLSRGDQLGFQKWREIASAIRRFQERPSDRHTLGA